MAGSTLRLEMLEYEAYIPMALQLQSTTVGTAGVYLQRGGHSYLTPSDDLAVDNHLEARVVTSDVLLHIVNEFSNPDLFYALWGGGGAIRGVLSVNF